MHLPQDKKCDAKDEQEWQGLIYKQEKQAWLFCGFDLNHYAFFPEQGDKAAIIWQRHCGERFVILQLAVDAFRRDGYGLNLARLNLISKRRIGNAVVWRGCPAEHGRDKQKRDNDRRPNGQVAEHRVAFGFLFVVHHHCLVL